jgi:hypothetical protein
MKILGKCKGWAWESSAFDIKKGHVTFDTPSFFLHFILSILNSIVIGFRYYFIHRSFAEK